MNLTSLDTRFQCPQLRFDSLGLRLVLFVFEHSNMRLMVAPSKLRLHLAIKSHSLEPLNLSLVSLWECVLDFFSILILDFLSLNNRLYLLQLLKPIELLAVNIQVLKRAHLFKFKLIS